MNETSPREAPGIDAGRITERKLFEAELFCRDAELREFGAMRERLVAARQDATAIYREILARRDALAAELRKLRASTPTTGAERPAGARPGESLLALPIASAKFNANLGRFGFGFSGLVQMPPATVGVSVVPGGPYISGEIVTISLGAAGNIMFDGTLHAGPDSIPPNQYNPAIQYFWLRNWSYLVPFPAPSVTSTFTYRFDVYAQANVFRDSGNANFMSFVSVGETANLLPGQNVTVDTDAGWPIVADLTQPTTTNGLYNGSYGFVDGQVTVQRSFAVGAGHTPGVAIVVGAVAGLSMLSDLRLFFPSLGESAIVPGQAGGATIGRIEYSFFPQLVARP
jgi:hypothetical protein